ncbi:NADH dehydrogenase (quinone) subunit D [Sulfurihydrogenibium yellowstonense]|uniref:NADH-quinone oxidoreductase subunit C/D n=1 Tax=Sulfurihydrogenibium yellowstonense SS-5 TaxID=432331 RepID=C4FLX0_9AQUI|nr:NADH dehydrogenase (quinone) subunit D [Sulfurihydrogenibium yellowstonense]EEP59929.1 NADH-quinone oxidoreductase, subunit c/d [Sulfurihydrogenibium yellowstonense SS-5]
MTWITLDKAKRINSVFNVKIGSYKDNVWVEIEKDNLINLLRFLKEDPDFSFKMFIDFTVVDYPYHSPRFQAVYILYSPEYSERIIVKTWTDDTLPSLINLWKGAKWAEREAYDMFGIKFDGHDNLVRMFLWETYPYYPLRKDFPKEGIKDTYLPSLNEGKNIPSHDYDPYHTAVPTLEDLEITERKRISKKNQIVLNWGPLHPGTHGTIWFLFDLEGETIRECDIILGQLHRGIEKLSEDLTYTQIIPYTDRMDYISALCSNIAYVNAVEKLLGVQPPEKAKWIRTMLAELQRINSHLLWLGTTALDLGALTMFLYTFREREKLMDIIEGIAGIRLNSSFLRIGGVRYDLPEDALDVIKHFIKDFPSRVKDYEDLLTKNRIWIRRNKDVGIVSKEDVYQYGLTGVMAKSAGVPYDIRYIQPTDAYADVDFEIPLGTVGDAYDRYLIRMEEMKQSLRIVQQCVDKLEKLKNDKYVATENPYVLPTLNEVYQSIESMVKDFTLRIYGEKAPVGEVYVSGENPRGELGFYIVSKGEGKPYRLRIRSGAFYNLQIFPELIKGRTVADAVALLGSIDPVVGETDR